MIMTDMKYDYVRGFLKRLDDIPDDFFEETWALMSKEALSNLKRVATGVGLGVTFARSLDVRYLGQGFELEVQVPAQFNRLRLRELFEQKHEAVYGYRHAGDPLEITALRLTVTAATAKPSLSLMARSGRRTGRETHRKVWFNDAWYDVPVLWRDNLSATQSFDGPMIIEEYDSTIIAPPGWNCSKNEDSCIIMERKS
jgi:N-methylhydantoinase A